MPFFVSTSEPELGLWHKSLIRIQIFVFFVHALVRENFISLALKRKRTMPSVQSYPVIGILISTKIDRSVFIQTLQSIILGSFSGRAVHTFSGAVIYFKCTNDASNDGK